MLSTIDRFRKRLYVVPLWGALLVLGVLASTNGAFAGVPVAGLSQVGRSDVSKNRTGDGFDKLPPGLRAHSMSSLVNMRLVHPALPTNLEPVKGLKPYNNPLNASITWQPAVKMTNQ